LDHLEAVRIIDSTHKAGGRILEYHSYCGGLPAPEDSGNPLGYKFSWSSRGVLLALTNSAKFYKDGKIEEISSSDLMNSAKPYHIYPGFAFVAYPNRDSTTYRQRYAIPEADTIIRGTLRYAGFPEFVRCLVDIGFLSDKKESFLAPSENPISWRDAAAKILGATSSSEADLIWAISSKTSFATTEEKDRIIAGLRWLGIFSDSAIVPRDTPLDTLCARLEKLCAYEPGERDMVMLQHKFVIENQDGTRETKTSTLVAYGDPKGYSAMSRLVSTPCAVAALKVLDGTIAQKGILAPITPEINDPLIKELKEKHNIEMKEKTVA
jgi:saccharopine dehydrogenase (NADP+, L-glutamate forming)